VALPDTGQRDQPNRLSLRHAPRPRDAVPATSTDLNDSQEMREDLRAAYDRNEEVLERLYTGHYFKNDRELLEKLFEMCTKMTGSRERPARSN